VASVFGDNAVGDGGVAVVAPDGPTGAIFVRTSKRIAVCDSKAREYAPAFPGIVDCLLNSGVLSWNTNVTYIVGCECITLAVVKKISCKSVARNSPFASSGSSKFGIKCAGNFPRTTQQAPLEVILIRSRGPACGW